jgi:hypothetical protein
MHAIAKAASQAEGTKKEAAAESKAAAAVNESPQQIPLWAAGPLPIQFSLKVNRPGDPYEQEADRVAKHVVDMPVMRMPERAVQRKTCACGRPTGPGGMCEECKRKQLNIQRKSSGDAGQSAAPPIVHQALQQPGRPLDLGTRSFMEARFGQDLGRVRVHTEGPAAASAAAVNARAYTYGPNIVFGSGEYAPATAGGRKLLAHELTHVIQQAGPAGPGQAIYRADRDAVGRVMALGRTLGSGIQFFPTNVVDTQVGPVSVRGGLLSSGASRLNVIIGENLTPRILARLILPLWTTATPFTPPGAAAPLPLDIIDDVTLARALLVHNQYYLALPRMTGWQSGLRFPLPVEIDEATGMATLHPAIIRAQAGAFDPAWEPLLDSRAAATTAPPAATLAADVTAFLARETTALGRGIHLGARAVTNAVAELPFIQECFRQLAADGFDVALEFMDNLVNREIDLLAAQRDGAGILAEIQTALGRRPAVPTADQQASLDRANLMLGRVAAVAAQPPPTATRTRPEKTVTVDTLKLVGSTHNPATQIAIANGVFSQCNVRILHGVNADDSTAAAPQTTTWLGGDTDIAAGTSCAAVTAEERRLFRDGSSHYGLGGGRFSAFFAATATGIRASGYSCPPARHPTAAIRDMIVVLNSGSTDTLAHELGHHLINPGSHGPASSVMASRPRPTLELTDAQCNRIYANA